MIIKIALLLFLSVVLPAEAQLLVKLNAKGKCAQLAEVILGREKNFLYHLQLPAGGNAEFKLVPGRYEINAVTKSNCNAIQKFEFDGKQQTVELTLKEKRSPKEQKRKPAYSEMVTGVCAPPGCGGGGGGYNMSFAPWMMPWWYPYYQPFWGNMGYPCAWSYYGCSAPQYPSGGPIVMGKPNIYFRGPNTKLKVSFGAEIMKGLIASAPAHMEKGWSIEVRNQKVEHKGTVYPYLYYDLRTAGAGLQFNSGFCGEKTELLSKMEEGLKALKFPDASLADFREHWAVHFPSGRKFCVLPQATNELNKAAPLEFSQPVDFVRMVYLVLPQEISAGEPQLGEAFKDYKPASMKAWSANAQSLSANSTQAFEWGLAFSFPNN